MSISVDIKKDFGNFLLDVAFEAGDETLYRLGASSYGRSLTLKCIAGIEKPDSGRIVVDGITLFDKEKNINLSPQERRTGLLFQNYALFPQMTARQNIATGARREKDKAKREQLVAEVITSFGLSELTGNLPSQLSGGEQQRTALARILVSSPRILLLDEPFSALDSHLRFKLEQEVKEVARQFGKTVILVSHDRDEVYRLSDRIAVMDEGRIVAEGEKSAVFAKPRTRSGAVLTGCKNISRARQLDGTHVMALDWGIKLAVSPDEVNAPFVGIRMHDIKAQGDVNVFSCRVKREIENPFSYTILLTPEDANSTMPIGWELDKDVWRSLRSEKISVALPPESLLMLRDE